MECTHEVTVGKRSDPNQGRVKNHRSIVDVKLLLLGQAEGQAIWKHERNY